MRSTGASLAVEALKAEGIPFAFGIPGTHNIELYDALASVPEVRPVLVTDEQSAPFMADGLWRASGKLGCVNLVPGAGLTHAISGIAEAYLDNVPLLVLGCGIRRDTGRAFQLHDVDQQALAGPVTKATFLVTSVGDLYPVIREACRVARRGPPGPVFVEVPADLYIVSGSSEARAGDPATDSGTSAPPDLREAIGILREAGRPLLYLGAGAAAGGERWVALAEHLESPVATTIQGKGVFPESHPLFLWPGFGDAAPPFARALAASCDATLAVGCRFSEVGTGSYGVKPPGPLIHVDMDPRVFNRNYEARVSIPSDATLFLEALLASLAEVGIGPRRSDAVLRERIRSGHEAVWKEWLAEVGGPGVTPAHLLRTLQGRLGPEAIYTTDSGNGTFLAMECLRLEAPGRFLAPVDYSSMGYAVPAALGAKLGRPEAPVVALAGDGAFLMTGLELLTAAREGLGVIVLVLRDRELAQIAQFQDTALGRKVASSVPDYHLGELAAGLGVAYLGMASDEEVGGVVDRAAHTASSGDPVLVEVAVDYSRKTFFTKGVVKTNFLRLPLRDQARFLGRALFRKVMG